MPNNTNTPIVIYTLHTKVPIGSKARIHVAEIQGMARWIGQDSAERIIFMGDLNTTPYAPAFGHLLKHSKLKHQNHNYIPEGTWPSTFLLPILKIQIDHILYSDALALLRIKKDLSIGSDHHSLIATFELE